MKYILYLKYSHDPLKPWVCYNLMNATNTIAVKASLLRLTIGQFEQNVVPILSYCVGWTLYLPLLILLLFFPILQSHCCVLVSHLESFLVEGREYVN